KIDAGKPLFGQRSLTQRLARTVFFGAAPTIGSAHKGLEAQRVFLGTATPGDVAGNFHSALAALADRATYFYSAGGRYWYDLQANISRRAKDLAERLHAEEVYAEIARRLNSQAATRGAFAGVHVCPEDAADIPDIDARLLGAYQWALVPTGQPIEIQATKVEGQAASLAERVSRPLGNDGALTVQHAAPAIRHQLDTTAGKLWADGHAAVGALWRLYAEYPYMPRLRDRAVLDAGLTGPQLLWEQEGFALADAYDEANAKYRALVVPTDGVTVAGT